MWDLVLLTDREGKVAWFLDESSLGTHFWDSFHDPADQDNIKSTIATVIQFRATRQIRCEVANWLFLVHHLPLGPEDFALVQGICFPGAVRLLTRRETETLSLMGQYLEPSEIAAQLEVSISTVEAHRRSIRKKLGVNDWMLPSIAHRAGLCEDPLNCIINLLVQAGKTGFPSDASPF